MNRVEQLNAILPQTQCQRCGYPACKPYAQAMHDGEALTNRCPPGGQLGADRLSALLGQASLTLDETRGSPGVRFTVRIIEDLCIGCTKCIRACPVDAIIGASKYMHTVIQERCNGCELCIPPCPTDCIVLEPRPDQHWSSQNANDAKRWFEEKNLRLLPLPKATPMSQTDAAPSNDQAKPAPQNAVPTHQSLLDRALAKARARSAK